MIRTVVLAAILLLWPTIVWAQGDGVTKALVAANGVASMVDYGVTMYGIADDQFREANPLLQWAERRPVAMGVTKGLVLAGTTAAILKLRKSHPKWALATAIGVTALNGYVAVRNARRLQHGE